MMGDRNATGWRHRIIWQRSGTLDVKRHKAIWGRLVRFGGICLIGGFPSVRILKAGGLNNLGDFRMTAWTCPRCRKPFDIPAGWETPKICAECKAAGPPKPPVPPKPDAPPPEIELVPPPLPGRRFLTPARIAGLSIVAVGLVAAIAYNVRENQAYETAVQRGRELDQAQDAIIAANRAEALERLSAPAVVACVICNGKKVNDCPICVDGVADCGGCTDGISTIGGKSERCFICAGKGKLKCDACNGKGKMACTFCNATGVQK